jgi:phage shock protein PspC (stress-responsive transcriptional regulator)
MSLTQQQERLIANYLREVALHIGPDVSTSRAQRTLDVLEARIRKAVESRGGVIQDADVARALDELGEPRRHAEEVRPDVKRQDGDKVWLGVCAHWAAKFDVPVRVVRIGVFLTGLLTGPLAPLTLWAYLAAYGHLWYITAPEKRPEIAYSRIAWNVFSCILIATLLSWVLDYALWGLEFGHQRLFEKPLPSSGGWGWIQYEAAGYYSLTLMTTLPLAILAGLPLAGGWDQSLKRLYLAILTIYGIYLSYGLASLIAGLVIEMVKLYGGVNIADYLPTT